MFALALQLYAPRVVQGVKIPHPCGDPTLLPHEDLRLRRAIVSTALKALQAEVAAPTLFRPEVTLTF